jgi:hypothetical protein
MRGNDASDAVRRSVAFRTEVGSHGVMEHMHPAVCCEAIAENLGEVPAMKTKGERGAADESLQGIVGSHVIDEEILLCWSTETKVHPHPSVMLPQLLERNWPGFMLSTKAYREVAGRHGN